MSLWPRAKDTAGARKAWTAARTAWERLQTVAVETFPELKKTIDGSSVAPTGFPAIATQLVATGKPEVLVPAAEALRDQLSTLEKKVRETNFTAQGLYNGMARLAFEISEISSKSKSSKPTPMILIDMRANFQGLAKLWETVFESPMEMVKREADAKIDKDLTGLKRLLDAADMSETDAQEVTKATERINASLAESATALGLEPPKLAAQN